MTSSPTDTHATLSARGGEGDGARARLRGRPQPTPTSRRPRATPSPGRAARRAARYAVADVVAPPTSSTADTYATVVTRRVRPQRRRSAIALGGSHAHVRAVADDRPLSRGADGELVKPSRELLEGVAGIRLLGVERRD